MDAHFPNEEVFSLITPPSEQKQGSPAEIPHGEELLRREAHDVIKEFGKQRKIETTGNSDEDTKYRLDYVTCLATPLIEKGIGSEKMLFRVVEELCPGPDSNIEPRGFSIRRMVVGGTNQSKEKIIVFIGTERIENALGEKATAEQIDVAKNLLSLVKKSLESLPQSTNSSISEAPIRMKYFPKASPVTLSREEGREPLSVSA
ncbi:MAG: hypothetical protein Q7R31_03180 [Candidatus Levybacteria bacterium]|nr:hypothetical protein [Candidatus Levybacteria bacterium]